MPGPSRKPRQPSKRDRALGMIRAGNQDDALIARAVDATEARVKAWRQQESEKPLVAPEGEAEGIPVEGDDPPHPKGLGRRRNRLDRMLGALGGSFEVDDLDDLETPDDFGPTLRRLTYRQMLTMERVLQVVGTAEYVLSNGAESIAMLLDGLGARALEILHANQANTLAQAEAAKAQLELLRAQQEAAKATKEPGVKKS